MTSLSAFYVPALALNSPDPGPLGDSVTARLSQGMGGCVGGDSRQALTEFDGKNHF